MTATIHRLMPELAGLPDASAERLLDAGHVLRLMAPSMASSIEVVGLEGQSPSVVVAAERIAATLDLVATVKTTPLLSVRFTRR